MIWFLAKKVDIELNNQVDESVLGIFIGRLFFWLGVLAFTFIVIGGIKYILAAGNPDKITSAKKTINYSIIGLIIASLSYVIISLVTGAFG